MRKRVAHRDDVELVPVLRLVVRVDHRGLAERREQTRILALLGPHDLAFPRDDAATRGLLVELARVAVPGIEVVLRAPHVPQLFGGRIGRRSSRRTARARALVAAPANPSLTAPRCASRSLRTRSTSGRCTAWGCRRRSRRSRTTRRATWGTRRATRASCATSTLRARRNPAAILHAAVDIAGA